MKLIHITFATLIAAGPAFADDAAPGYAFAGAPEATTSDPSSDAMTDTLRAQIRAKYGDQLEAGDMVALRALAAADDSVPAHAKNAGPIRFSSDRFSRPKPAAAPASNANDDAATIVAGMSPDQIRAVMTMAQAMAEMDGAPAVPAAKTKTVSVGTGQNMLIEDWIAGVDASGGFYIENTQIPGSRVPLKDGSVVGALGKVRDMRVSGGQTQITFASGDMIVGDAPTVAGHVPGDNLSGEIIVSGAAPAPTARMSTKSTPTSPDQVTGAKNSASAVSDAAATDPQTSTKAKTMSDSKLAPSRSRRPLHKPPHEGGTDKATSVKSSHN